MVGLLSRGDSGRALVLAGVIDLRGVVARRPTLRDSDPSVVLDDLGRGVAAGPAPAPEVVDSPASECECECERCD